MNITIGQELRDDDDGVTFTVVAVETTEGHQNVNRGVGLAADQIVLFVQVDSGPVYTLYFYAENHALLTHAATMAKENME